MSIFESLSVNQILVACLILILVVFLVFMGRLVAELIKLLKSSKKLVSNGQELVETSKTAVQHVENKIVDAADGIIKKEAPVTKAVVAVAGVVIALNLSNQIRKYLLKQGGTVAYLADKKARKKTKKQINKSKRELKKIKARTKAEKKMAKKAKKIAAAARKASK